MFWSKPLAFISYSRKDKEQVDRLSNRLRKKGVRSWVDRQDILGGDWRQSIKKALRDSDFFVACLSRNTVQRGEVLQYEHDSALEVQREALEGPIYLLPVRLEPCDLPDGLKNLQCFDIYEPAEWDSFVRALCSKAKFRSGLFVAVAAIVVLSVLAGYLLIRQPSEQKFIDARAAGKSAAATDTVSLGVTLWKMEPSISSDPPSIREIVHPAANGPPAQPVEWTPVRLPAGAEFRLGDEFEVGIEASRTGYLYVVNRALRQDGSAGPASLIFPTNRIRDGHNLIWPGKIVSLPDRDSNPPYWKFESSRPDYAGELLIVMLRPRPLDDLTSRGGAAPIPDSLLADWVKKYGGGVRSNTFETSGARLTVEEAAARDQSAQLTRTAPLPQVLFSANRPSDGSILATLPLRVRR